MSAHVPRNLAALALLFGLLTCVRRRPGAPDVAGTVVEPLPAPSSAMAVDDSAMSAPWTVEVTDGGTLRVNYRGMQVLTFHYMFWGTNFSWANPVVKNARSAAGVTTFDLDVDSLGLKIVGRIAKVAANEIAADYAVTAERPQDDVVGGGIEFNLGLDAPVPGKENSPQLFADNRGFKWDAASLDSISVLFDPPLPAAFFERDQRNTIRCFLVGRQIRPGTSQFSMRLRLPRGGAVRKSVDERYGQDDRATWYRGTLEWDRWPVDVGFLNDRPAGRHGKVRAKGDRLVFEDRTEARFWGANLQAYALFDGKKEDVANQAKRMAALGYNLVRLHHHDSDWVSPNVFDRASGTTQKLSDFALDRLDWWVKCLKEEGIYVWLDLHVGRQFLKGDKIDGFSELAKGQGSGKGFNYLNPRIEKLMQQFADQYIDRSNRYTGTPYADEPALAFVLITNENDLTFHFANLLVADKGNPVHHRLFESVAKDIARRTGISAAASTRVWEPGPSKIVLNEIEHLYDARAIEHLRADGLKALVATTSFWGAESMFSLPSLASGDIVDVHSYGKAESLGTNPRYEANFISWIGAAQLAGRPLSISEWNVEYPNRDRFIAPLYVAAISSLQGWDAPMIYGYSQVPVHDQDKPDTYSTWNDPALTALMPAAALMFRQGHVKPARRSYRLDLSRENLYYANTSPDSSSAIRTLVEQSKFTVGLPDVSELAWDDALSTKSPDATSFTELDRDFIPQGQNFVVSDTGEVKRDWALGIETIDTALSQAAVGWIGGRSIGLTDVTIDIRTSKAAVAVTSMDGRPIATSKKVLVTTVAQVLAGPDDKLPFLAQPVEGTIAIRSKEALRLVPLSPRANPASQAPAERFAPILPVQRGNEQVFTLGRNTPTHWFLLVP